eukprot:13805420-Alexandrium_andersonii.AAC.1
MSASLVGSEMCIRDRSGPVGAAPASEWPRDAPRLFDVIELRPHSTTGRELRRQAATVAEAGVGPTDSVVDPIQLRFSTKNVPRLIAPTMAKMVY